MMQVMAGGTSPRTGEARDAVPGSAGIFIDAMFSHLVAVAVPGSAGISIDAMFSHLVAVAVPGSAGILPATGRRPATVEADRMPALPGSRDNLARWQG